MVEKLSTNLSTGYPQVGISGGVVTVAPGTPAVWYTVGREPHSLRPARPRRKSPNEKGEETQSTVAIPKT